MKTIKIIILILIPILGYSQRDTVIFSSLFEVSTADSVTVSGVKYFKITEASSTDSIITFLPAGSSFTGTKLDSLIGVYAQDTSIYISIKENYYRLYQEANNAYLRALSYYTQLFALKP